MPTRNCLLCAMLPASRLSISFNVIASAAKQSRDSKSLFAEKASSACGLFAMICRGPGLPPRQYQDFRLGGQVGPRQGNMRLRRALHREPALGGARQEPRQGILGK